MNAMKTVTSWMMKKYTPEIQYTKTGKVQGSIMVEFQKGEYVKAADADRLIKKLYAVLKHCQDCKDISEAIGRKDVAELYNDVLNIIKENNQ